MSNQPVTTTTSSVLQVEKTDLRYLLNLVKNEIKSEINCHAIGTIQNFDPITQTCSVLFNYQKVLKKRNALSPISNSYTDVVIPYPMLIRVPVIFLGGGGSFLTFPISGIVTDSNGKVTYPGDTCVVMFIDRDMDLWLELGGTLNPPLTERLHDISDGVALVGLSAVNKALKNFNTNIINMVDRTGSRIFNSGMIIDWAGNIAPNGWLLCYGQSLSTTDYPDLFAEIQYIYGGSGDSFNVPDCRGRVSVGLDNMGGIDAMNLYGVDGTEDLFTTERTTLGGIVGECMHIQTIDELVTHDHDFIIYSAGGPTPDVPAGTGENTPSPTATDVTGGGLPSNIVQPGIMFNRIIKI